MDSEVRANLGNHVDPAGAMAGPFPVESHPLPPDGTPSNRCSVPSKTAQISRLQPEKTLSGHQHQAGENLWITCSRSVHTIGLSRRHPPQGLARHTLSPVVADGTNRFVNGFPPGEQARLCPAKFFAIITLSLSFGSYPPDLAFASKKTTINLSPFLQKKTRTGRIKFATSGTGSGFRRRHR